MKPIRNLLDEFTPFRAASAPASARLFAEPAQVLTKAELVTSWVCRSIAAAIMIETLFFKFTGSPESVYIIQ